MKCDICESNKTYIKNYEHIYFVKGKEIKFCSKRRFCEECNNLVYDSELDNAASEVAIKIYNEKYGISKEEIIDLRAKYNLSLELFSKIIGCAKKTLISYEKGKSIPNDSYLIILKSLIAKPETIITLIEANKEQFTNKEITKINNKLSIFLPNNTKQLLFNTDGMPDEFNGYSKFSKEKIYNIILYFADSVIFKTKLLKEMFYADFLYYKNACKSMTGLEYSKLKFGPVPDQFEEILKQGAIESVIDYEASFENQYECYNISAKKTFDASLFNSDELKILETVKHKFNNYSVKDIVEFSHKEKAFIETDFYNKISYDYAFDIESFETDF